MRVEGEGEGRLDGVFMCERAARTAVAAVTCGPLNSPAVQRAVIKDISLLGITLRQRQAPHWGGPKCPGVH